MSRLRLSRRSRIAVAVAALCVVAGAVFGGVLLAPGHAPLTRAVARPPVELLSQPIPDSVPNAAQLRRGQYLVRAGDCASCHTPEGGRTLSGGFALNTPFGVIYSTNLTSDPETGLGRVSPEVFYQVLHAGRGPGGSQVYPAMPYPYFSRVSRADSDAMLAYLKTLPALRAERPPNRLPFPLNVRPLVAGWNAVGFQAAGFTPDPARSAEWNRGAYLVNGLGHCGACHTPKTLIATDKATQVAQGGTLDGWVAPDLTANPRTGLGAWSVEDVVGYLKTGRNRRANAAGPMAEVVANSTSQMTDPDLHAMAVYLKDLPASPSQGASQPDPVALRRGAAIYADVCSACHRSDGRGQPGAFPPLGANAMLQQRDPTGVIHLLLAGGRTAPTATRPSPLAMPSFAWKLDDRQTADVATYIRNSWGNQAPPVRAPAVASLRRQLRLEAVRLPDNAGDHAAPRVQETSR